MNPIKHIACLLGAIGLAGCATIFSGTSQTVEIKAKPGVRYVVTNAYGSEIARGEAPASVDLTRRAGYFSPQAYRVALSQPGYKPRSVAIEPGMNPWYFMNILIGGFIGMVIVDPLTGAMYKFSPGEIDVTLEPTGEDIAKVERTAAIVARAKGRQVSRWDYEGQQIAKAAGCVIVANPEVQPGDAGKENLIFDCDDGSTRIVSCSSSGCR